MSSTLLHRWPCTFRVSLRLGLALGVAAPGCDAIEGLTSKADTPKDADIKATPEDAKTTASAGADAPKKDPERTPSTDTKTASASKPEPEPTAPPAKDCPVPEKTECPAPDPDPGPGLGTKISFANLRGVGDIVAMALDEGNAGTLRRQLSAPFRLVAGPGVSFCGTEGKDAPVVTEFATDGELDEAVRCILADAALRKAYRKATDGDVVLANRADLDDEYGPLLGETFRQTSDYVYVHLMAPPGNGERFAKCFLSLRAVFGTPRASALACQFESGE